MPDSTEPQKMVFNGVRARGGGYALQLTTTQVKDLALGKTLDQESLNELKRKTMGAPRSFEVGAGPSFANDGWGLILPATLDLKNLHGRLDALGELLDLRREAAGGRFKIFSGEQGCLPDASKRDWLMQVKTNPDGSPDPEKVPLYLLIAASPEEIPYSLQYQLDVQYHTGRIYFEKLDDWANYAHSVAEVEKHGLRLPRQAALWAPSNPDDEATRLSCETLAKPLRDYIKSGFRLRSLREKLISQITLHNFRYQLKDQDYTEKELLKISRDLGLTLAAADLPTYKVSTALGAAAKRDKLEAFLGGAETPALLFTASHGMVFDDEDQDLQERHQGALLCQDWTGPNQHQGDISDTLYFAADHLSRDAHLLGMLAFFFACYSGGTPQYDEFVTYDGKAKTIAKRSFLASLPMRMLSHPHGSALAVVAHVERAWGCSFTNEEKKPQLNVFEDTFGQLLQGNTLGEAMDPFNLRYAELATDISTIQIKNRIPTYILDEFKLSDMWVRHNDARNYVILGDPAVRLPTAAQPQGERKLALELTSPGQRPAYSPELHALIENALGGNPAAQPKPLTPGLAPGTQPDITGPSVDYSTFGKNFEQIQKDFAASLQRFVDQLSTYVGKIARDVSDLKIETYTASDLTDVDSNGYAQNAELAGRTIVGLSGDTRLEISTKSSSQTNHLHLEMVKLAQANRTELLKTLAGSLVGLKDLLKP